MITTTASEETNKGIDVISNNIISSERAESNKTMSDATGLKSLEEGAKSEILNVPGQNADAPDLKKDGSENKIKLEEEDEDEDDDDDDDEDTAGNNADMDLSDATHASKRSKTTKEVEEEVPMTFPQKLMEILSNEDHADIISWLTNGRGFMIYNKKRFSVEVLPKYFKKSKFTSFTRKLNRWNFTRITRGPETGAYYHEFFERGNLRLCMQMCCQSSKNFPTSSTSGSGGIPGAPTMTGGNLMGMAHSNPSGFALSSPSALEGISGINRTLGQSMNRLRLGESMERAAGGMMGNDPLRSLGLLQNQMQAQMAAAAVAAGYGTPNVNNNTGNDTLLQQLRQLEHQRDILLKQQQQQQQIQQIHQLQQLQQQQQQLALLGLQGVSGGNLSGMPSPDLSLGTLQRSNTNSYLAMLMAQEKLQAQLGSLTTSASPSLLDFQRQQANILQAQQQQLEHYNQQRLLQAALQQHQQQQQQQHQLQHQQQLQLDASCAQNPSSLLLSQLLGGGANGGGSIPLTGDIIQGVNSSTSSDSSNPPDLDHRGKLNKRGGSAA